MWCEMVGWLLPSGVSKSHQRISTWEATREKPNRTGSATRRGPRRSAARLVFAERRVDHREQHRSSSTTAVVIVALVLAIGSPT